MRACGPCGLDGPPRSGHWRGTTPLLRARVLGGTFNGGSDLNASAPSCGCQCGPASVDCTSRSRSASTRAKRASARHTQDADADPGTCTSYDASVKCGTLSQFTMMSAPKGGCDLELCASAVDDHPCRTTWGTDGRACQSSFRPAQVDCTSGQICAPALRVVRVAAMRVTERRRRLPGGGLHRQAGVPRRSQRHARMFGLHLRKRGGLRLRGKRRRVHDDFDDGVWRQPRRLCRPVRMRPAEHVGRSRAASHAHLRDVLGERRIAHWFGGGYQCHYALLHALRTPGQGRLRLDSIAAPPVAAARGQVS